MNYSLNCHKRVPRIHRRRIQLKVPQRRCSDQHHCSTVRSLLAWVLVLVLVSVLVSEQELGWEWEQMCLELLSESPWVVESAFALAELLAGGLGQVLVHSSAHMSPLEGSGEV